MKYSRIPLNLNSNLEFKSYLIVIKVGVAHLGIRDSGYLKLSPISTENFKLKISQFFDKIITMTGNSGSTIKGLTDTIVNKLEIASAKAIM